MLTVERQLLVDGQPAPVGSRAFDLLVELIEGRSNLVTKARLLDAVWPGLVVGENNLQAQVSALRKIIGAGAIKTVAGLGYRFAAPMVDEQPAGIAAKGRVHPAGALANALRIDAKTQSRIDRMAVFEGAFRLEAAARMVSEGPPGAASSNGALDRLLAFPQIERVPTSPPRLRLPEEVRHSARDRLRAAGQMDAAIARHGQAMAAIGRKGIEEFWESCNEADWVSTYRWDHDDLDAAFQRASERRDAAIASAVLATLGRLEIDRDTSRARQRKEATFNLLRYTIDPETRVALLGYITILQSVAIPQITFLDAAIERESLSRQLESRRVRYGSLVRLANAYAYSGKFEEMESAFRGARALVDPRWPPRVRWNGAFNEANARQMQGDAEGARASAEEMMRIAAEMGDEATTAMSRHAMALAAMLGGDLPGAIAIFEENIDQLRDAALWRVLANSQAYLCGAYLRSGDLGSARQVARRTLPLVSAGDAFRLLDHVALLCVRSGRFHEAALLLGHGDIARDWKARPGPSLGPHATWEAANAVQRALGAREHGRLRRMGAEMSQDQVKAIAREAIEWGSRS